MTIPPEVISDREFEEHLDRMSAYFERGERPERMSFDTVDAALEWLKTLCLRAAKARRG